jgi:hypothetical protein
MLKVEHHHERRHRHERQPKPLEPSRRFHGAGRRASIPPGSG